MKSACSSSDSLSRIVCMEPWRDRIERRIVPGERFGEPAETSVLIGQHRMRAAPREDRVRRTVMGSTAGTACRVSFSESRADDPRPQRGFPCRGIPPPISTRLPASLFFTRRGTDTAQRPRRGRVFRGNAIRQARRGRIRNEAPAHANGNPNRCGPPSSIARAKPGGTGRPLRYGGARRRRGRCLSNPPQSRRTR